MSEIVGFAGMSHSPFAGLLPPQGPDDPGAEFLRSAARVEAAVRALAPDAVVVIGPDHFHANFYDVMPPFVLGVEQVTGFGDFGSTAGPLPVASELAWHIQGELADDFDLALSYSLTVDHGVVQSYEMTTGGTTLPMVPLVINTAAPPLPSLARCADLGRALGAALRSAPLDLRVLVVASGGLSHWLPSNDPRDMAADDARRDPLIHGRKDARAFAAAREPRVRAMGGNPDARVNAGWDAWFLTQLKTSDLAPIVELGHERLEREAGTGGHEVRSWLIGHAAVGAPLVWSSYDPVPEWITGMAAATTFDVPLDVPCRGAPMSVADAAERLSRAQRTATPCPPVRDLLRAADLDAEVDLAYQVQQAVVGARVRDGRRGIGRKIGLTNPKVRAQLGVDRPDFGILLDDMRRAADEPIDTTRLLAPRIEAEIAFVLGADLDGPHLSTDDVRAATAHVRTAFEIVDSRVAGWDITITDTIADNGSSALFVLGPDEVELAHWTSPRRP